MTKDDKDCTPQKFMDEFMRWKRGSISRRHFMGVTGLGLATAVLSRFPGAKVVEVRRLAPEAPETNINADYGSDDPPDGSDGDDL